MTSSHIQMWIATYIYCEIFVAAQNNTQHCWVDNLAKLISDVHKKRNQRVVESVDGFSFLEAGTFFIGLDECWLLCDEENKKDSYLYDAKQERALLSHLMKYRLVNFYWIIKFDILFSNNTSERDLRGGNLKLKVAKQFQNISSPEIM